MRILRTAAAFAVVLGFALTASAQGLGDLAAKEKQKRQGKPAPKVITDDDLGQVGKRGTFSTGGDSSATEAAPAGDVAVAPAPPEGTTPAEGAVDPQASDSSEPTAPPAPAAGQAAPKKEKTEEELQAERRAEWQKKLGLARDKVRVHQTNVDNLQRDLSDPTSGTYTDRRVQAQKLLDSEKASLAAAQGEVASLEEEGRRNAWPR